jgi:fructokinase
MIAVTGEALIDLIVGPGGQADARPGGGPFNVARAIGRLGLAPAFLGRLSGDGFGRMLRASLDRDGVSAAIPGPAGAPTTLAVVDIEAGGAARYRFYLSGTSACELDYPQLAAALPKPLTALHAGSLGLVAEPAAASIERLIAGDLPPGALVMIDPNCRPGAIPDREAYTGRLRRVLRRADVVKVSTEDLAYLDPGRPARDAALALLGQGPGLVLVTDGPRPARALLPGHELAVPVPAVAVADTIGAGDAFGGAFLAWWTGSNLSRSDFRQLPAVRAALLAAVEVAVLTCVRAGAEPPWAAELADSPGWRWLTGPG